MNYRICLFLLCNLLLIPTLLAAQNRDLRSERIVIDDNGADGTVHTMTIRTPDSLPQNIVLTIPDPGSGTAQFLLSTSGSNGAWMLGGNTGTTPGTNFLGTTDSSELHFYVNSGTNNSLILNVNGSMQRDAGGDVRGVNAVDLQIFRADNAEVASAEAATIGGGIRNTASGINATVGGGSTNTAAGTSSTVGGGDSNTIGGRYSAIPGGHGLTLDTNAAGSFGFLGGNITGAQGMSINTPDVAVFGNTDLWLANNDNGSSELRFYEPNTTTGSFPNGTNFTAFRAAPQGSDITYVLPDTAGIPGDALKVAGVSGSTITLDWDAAGSGNGSAWSLTGDTGTTPGTHFIGTRDNQPFEIHVYENEVAGTPTGGSGRVARFEPRAGAGNGPNIILGYKGNAVNGGVEGGTIGGGGQNDGGSSNENRVTGSFGTISGGAGNTSGLHAFVGGGQGNTASGVGAVVAGGDGNRATSFWAITVGGLSNLAGGNYSVVPGGRGMELTGAGSFAFMGGNPSGSGRGNNWMGISSSDVAVFGNVDMWLANNNNSASELRFYEPNPTAGVFPNGTNFTAFRAQIQTSDITYTLPATLPAVQNGTTGDLGGGALLTDATGALIWGEGAVLTANLNFLNTANAATDDQTITVNGAMDGDIVSLGIPNAAQPAGIAWYQAWVSAANTITIRFFNLTGAAVDPDGAGGATFSIAVTRP